MQNNICIIAVKLNAHNVFLHTNSRAETFAPLVNSVIDDEIVRNDARYRSSAASVHRRHRLARPVAAFFPIVCTQPGSNLCCSVEKVLLKWMQVSRFRRLIVSHAQWAQTSPYMKIKNSPQISRMTGSSFLANVNSCSCSLCCRASVCRLSSVCRL